MSARGRWLELATSRSRKKRKRKLHDSCPVISNAKPGYDPPIATEKSKGEKNGRVRSEVSKIDRSPCSLTVVCTSPDDDRMLAPIGSR